MMAAMLDRRVFTLLALHGASGVVKSQSVPRLPRIGYLSAASQGGPEIALLRESLAARGHVDGRTVVLDVRYAAGQGDLAQQHARELVASKPDVLACTTTQMAVALHGATRSLPIVFGYVSDPVGAGLVKSLAAPGTNATGIADFGLDLSGKWLEIALDVKPRTRKVGVLMTRASPHPWQFNVIAEHGLKKDIRVTPYAGGSEAEVEISLRAAAREGVQTVIALGGAAQTRLREFIATKAAAASIAAIGVNRRYPEHGFLLSYGPSHEEQYRTVAAYVSRILSGQQPTTLPVAQPRDFELVVNLRTASRIGVKLPQYLLDAATHVIE